MNTKQVIILRKDLKMRRGKEISQGSHASMAFITKNMHIFVDVANGNQLIKNLMNNDYERVKEIDHWLHNSFRKIVCYVDSLEELEEIHQKAIEAGLMSHMIEDNGVTEFGGVKTKTCIAVGPAWEDKFVGITDHLRLA